MIRAVRGRRGTSRADRLAQSNEWTSIGAYSDMSNTTVSSLTLKTLPCPGDPNSTYDWCVVSANQY